MKVQNRHDESKCSAEWLNEWISSFSWSLEGVEVFLCVTLDKSQNDMLNFYAAQSTVNDAPN